MREDIIQCEEIVKEEEVLQCGLKPAIEVCFTSVLELDRTRSIPNWVWLLCSICTFLGHTLDGTDGKQARRMGVSGPTGELFDHGLDSWSTVPLTLTIFSIFGQGEFSLSPVRLLLVLISVQAVFIVSHWEKYNTGILFLPWNYDLSQYDNFYEMCLPLYPSLILFSISILWALYSPGKIIERDPRLYLYTMGTVFSNIACKLIIAQMCNTRAELFNLCLAVYSIVAITSLSGFLSAYQELIFLRLAVAVIISAHLHFGICVVRQLCEHFKISAFSLHYLQHSSKHYNE
ncbi:unnamed protein product [Acanthocheilonema viteae]|uniref:CDP-alcohol phosphatidyltransferase n=1 Tax=Acanthocheilonema viteae TaxID=6277 RepID=A0A498SMF4_ACAVI|nr:unnamed protein product [Acanthocheilonema viteae]